MTLLSGLIYSYIGFILTPYIPYCNNINIHNLENFQCRHVPSRLCHEIDKPVSYPMYRLGGNGGWGKFVTLEDENTNMKENKEKKLVDWVGASGIYILQDDGTYEIIPHTLEKKKEDNERHNEEQKNKENKNTTASYDYWGTITSNMIDENKRRVDDYSYKNKVDYSMKTNWYYHDQKNIYRCKWY